MTFKISKVLLDYVIDSNSNYPLFQVKIYFRKLIINEDS